jgi:hypothetical protein
LGGLQAVVCCRPRCKNFLPWPLFSLTACRQW